jgi:hypothetical protein
MTEIMNIIKKRLILAEKFSLTDEQIEAIKNLTKQVFTAEHFTEVMKNDTKHLREEDLQKFLPRILKKFKNTPVSEITKLNIIRFIEKHQSLMFEAQNQDYCCGLLVKEVAEKALDKSFSINDIDTSNNEEIKAVCKVIQETLGMSIHAWNLSISKSTIHYLDLLSQEILDKLQKEA